MKKTLSIIMAILAALCFVSCDPFAHKFNDPVDFDPDDQIHRQMEELSDIAFMLVDQADLGEQRNIIMKEVDGGIEYKLKSSETIKILGSHEVTKLEGTRTEDWEQFYIKVNLRNGGKSDLYFRAEGNTILYNSDGLKVRQVIVADR